MFPAVEANKNSWIQIAILAEKLRVSYVIPEV